MNDETATGADVGIIDYVLERGKDRKNLMMKKPTVTPLREEKVNPALADIFGTPKRAPDEEALGRGVDTGYDMVIIGSAFIVGGLVTLPFESWVVTVIVVSVICAAYVLFGRKYVHRRLLVKEEKTNIDVSLTVDNGNVLLTVEDNGSGFDTEQVSGGKFRKGIGLSGIEERMEALGGKLVVESHLGLGTILTACVPWRDKDD